METALSIRTGTMLACEVEKTPLDPDAVIPKFMEYSRGLRKVHDVQ
jgi:hypothetical protein